MAKATSNYLNREYGPVPILHQNKKVPYENILFDTLQLYKHYKAFRTNQLDAIGERDFGRHFLLYCDTYCIGIRTAMRNVIGYKRYVNSWKNPQLELQLEERIVEENGKRRDV